MSVEVKLNKRKNEWGEYKVRVYVDGKLNEDASYYTEDWEDAEATAEHIRKNSPIDLVSLESGKIRWFVDTISGQVFHCTWNQDFWTTAHTGVHEITEEQARELLTK
jgi:hypothetical protein